MAPYDFYFLPFEALANSTPTKHSTKLLTTTYLAATNSIANATLRQIANCVVVRNLVEEPVEIN